MCKKGGKIERNTKKKKGKIKKIVKRKNGETKGICEEMEKLNDKRKVRIKSKGKMY